MSGAIPTILPEALKILPAQELEALNALVSGKFSFNLESQPEASAAVLRSALIRLGVFPVPGRDGGLVYRAWVKSRLVLVVDTATVEDTPARVWQDCTSVDELIQAIQECVRGRNELDGGEFSSILSEDHPEEKAIGFTCPEAGRVWAISTDAVEADLAAKRITSPSAATLITSASGRVRLATVLEAELLDDPSLNPEPDTIPPSDRRATLIDAVAAGISARYKARYLKGVRT